MCDAVQFTPFQPFAIANGDGIKMEDISDIGETKKSTRTSTKSPKVKATNNHHLFQARFGLPLSQSPQSESTHAKSVDPPPLAPRAKHQKRDETGCSWPYERNQDATKVTKGFLASFGAIGRY